MHSDCCHSSFEAVEDRSLLSQDDRAKVHLLSFLIKDLAERPVLLDLGPVLVIISCICYGLILEIVYVADTRCDDKYRTNHVL